MLCLPQHVSFLPARIGHMSNWLAVKTSSSRDPSPRNAGTFLGRTNDDDAPSPVTGARCASGGVRSDILGPTGYLGTISSMQTNDVKMSPSYSRCNRHHAFPRVHAPSAASVQTKYACLYLVRPTTIPAYGTGSYASGEQPGHARKSQPHLCSRNVSYRDRTSCYSWYCSGAGLCTAVLRENEPMTVLTAVSNSATSASLANYKTTSR